MESNLLVGLGAGLLIGPSLIPDKEELVPQPQPAKSLSGTPFGHCGGGILRGAVILGSVAVAPQNPEIAGAAIVGVGLYKGLQASWDSKSTGFDVQRGLAVALLALGAGIAFGGGKTFGASRTAAAVLGAMFVSGSAVLVYRQRQVNDEKALAA